MNDDATSAQASPAKRARLFDLLGASRGATAMRLATSATVAAGAPPSTRAPALAAAPARQPGAPRARLDFGAQPGAGPAARPSALIHIAPRMAAPAAAPASSRLPISQLLLNRARGSGAPPPARPPGPAVAPRLAAGGLQQTATATAPRHDGSDNGGRAASRFDRPGVPRPAANAVFGGGAVYGAGLQTSTLPHSQPAPPPPARVGDSDALEPAADAAAAGGAAPGAQRAGAAEVAAGTIALAGLQGTEPPPVPHAADQTPTAVRRPGRRKQLCGDCGNEIAQKRTRKRAADGAPVAEEHRRHGGFLYCPTQRGIMSAAERAADVAAWRAEMDLVAAARRAPRAAAAPRPAPRPASAPAPVSPVAPSRQQQRAGGKHRRSCTSCTFPLRNTHHRSFRNKRYCPWLRGALTDAVRDADFERWKQEVFPDAAMVTPAPPPADHGWCVPPRTEVPRRARSARGARAATDGGLGRVGGSSDQAASALHG